MATLNKGKTTLKDVEFSVDRDKNGNVTNCYMALTYVFEDDHKIEEIHIPQVQIPISIDECNIEHEYLTDPYSVFKKFYITGHIHGDRFRLRIYPENDVHYETRIIKEKSVKMTVEEIEKKLGYSIEIVSDKKKKKYFF